VSLSFAGRQCNHSVDKLLAMSQWCKWFIQSVKVLFCLQKVPGSYLSRQAEQLDGDFNYF
jgi:hypothetical protein